MHDDLTDLARRSLRQALARSKDDLWVVLETFGWRALAETDEAFAFTALFEELGRPALRLRCARRRQRRAPSLARSGLRHLARRSAPPRAQPRPGRT